MISNDVLNELNEAKQKMGREWILDLEKIERDDIYGTRMFATWFSQALNNFKLIDPNDKIHFESACEEFLKYYTQAQNNHWIIKKPELEKNTKLEKILTDNEIIIKKQQQLIGDYQSQIKELLKIHPQFEKFFGVHDGGLDFE